MKKVAYLKVQSSEAPVRTTQPRSVWRELFGSMRRGDWMFVERKDHSRVGASASIYLRGKYTMYKVPEGYCLMVIK